MKTKEELNALKEEVEALNAKLAELSEEEMAQVTAGVVHGIVATAHKSDFASVVYVDPKS